jgi:CBS domain containing-hemolysin-like protein
MSEFLHTTELWLPGLIAMLALMGCSAFLAASETALFFLSHDEIRAFRAGTNRERGAVALLADPDRVLTGILFWNLLVNLLYFAISIVVSQRLIQAGLGTAAAVFGFAALIALLLWGEVLPKVVASVFRRKLAPRIVWPVASIVRILDPVLPLARGLTLIARRTFLPHVHQEAYLSTEDLETAVNVSELRPEALRQEKQILHNILDLSEITAEEIMRPKGTYAAYRPPICPADFGEKIPPGDYVAVLGEESEDVEAVIALWRFIAVPSKRLDLAAEEVVYIPWCAKLSTVLSLLREQFASVASVINEYGDTIGILTYDDLMDAILIPEPNRALRFLPRDPVLEVAPGCYHVEGITTLRHLCARLGIEYEPDADELVTLAGLLHEKLEHIPAVGDEATWRDYQIRVIEVSKRGRLRAMLTKEHPSPEVSA